jgi:hypothetical protein
LIVEAAQHGVDPPCGEARQYAADAGEQGSGTAVRHHVVVPALYNHNARSLWHVKVETSEHAMQRITADPGICDLDIEAYDTALQDGLVDACARLSGVKLRA